ncbi:MAG: serine hydrolase domain-containing protein [Pseudomonadota bacterium]
MWLSATILFTTSLPSYANKLSQNSEFADLSLNEKQQSVADELDRFFSEIPEFSGVVLVTDRGAPIYKRALGWRDFSTDSPMREDSIFELASVSKPFTAMAVLLLVKDGVISLDDPLEKHIPGLEYDGVTIRHLLTHTSGVPDYMKIMSRHWDKRNVAVNADAISYLKQYRPEVLFKPGEDYKYSNTGYLLLASIVEAASGQDFADFSRQRIFAPLEMNDTDIRNHTDWDKIDRFAVGFKKNRWSGKYVRAVDVHGDSYAVWLGGRYGPGRVSSTVDDLSKWDRSLYTEKLISYDLIEAAFTKGVLNNGVQIDYGFGWFIEGEDHPLGKIVHHSGGNPGIATSILRCIESDIAVIVLNNTGGFEVISSLNEKLVKELLAQLRLEGE